MLLWNGRDLQALPAGVANSVRRQQLKGTQPTLLESPHGYGWSTAAAAPTQCDSLALGWAGSSQRN